MKMAGIGFSAGRFIHLFPYRNFFPKNNLFQRVVSILSDLIYDKMSKLIFNFFSWKRSNWFVSKELNFGGSIDDSDVSLFPRTRSIEAQRWIGLNDGINTSSEVLSHGRFSDKAGPGQAQRTGGPGSSLTEEKEEKSAVLQPRFWQ